MNRAVKKKHILVVSQYFYPEAFRINDICREWIKRGYRVTAVTGIPNYPEGKFYPGYGVFKKRTETWKGIHIIRLPLVPRGTSAAGLAANYLSFVVSAFFWVRFTKLRADYVFTSEVSPMTQALLGVWYAKKHRIPNYLYVQDLWPENVETVTGISHPLVIKPIEKMVEYIYRNCDHIFATSPGFVKEIAGRAGREDKIHYWPQYAEDFYRPSEKKPAGEIPEEEVFKVIFTGNIGYAQGLSILPETAQLLKDSGTRVKFYIVGDGRYREELEKEIRQKGIDDMFRLVERQPAGKIPELLAACDAAFLSFKDDPLFSMTIPAKLQSYMACGIPVIAAADGETRRIIEDAGCGVVSVIGNPADLCAAIERLAASGDLCALGRNARDYYEKYFDKERLLQQIEKYFR